MALKFYEVKITVIIVLFEKNNGFYAVVAISQNFLWNCNYSKEIQKTVIFQKIDGFRSLRLPL